MLLTWSTKLWTDFLNKENHIHTVRDSIFLYKKLKPSYLKYFIKYLNFYLCPYVKIWRPISSVTTTCIWNHISTLRMVYLQCYKQPKNISLTRDSKFIRIDDIVEFLALSSSVLFTVKWACNFKVSLPRSISKFRYSTSNSKNILLPYK